MLVNFMRREPPVWRTITLLLPALFVTPLRAQLPAARLSGLFPAGGRPGETVEVTVYGADLDDASQLWFSHPGLRSEQKMADPGPFDNGPQPVPNVFLVQIAQDVPPGCYDVRVQGLYGLSNPRTFVVGTQPELREAEPNDDLSQAQSISLPVVVHGQANSAGDVDCYRVALAAGQRVGVRVIAQKIDSPMDPVLRIEKPNGAVLGEWDNVFDSDVLVTFTAPESGEYRFLVADAVYRGSAEYVYRLEIGNWPVVDFVFPPAVEPGTTARLTLWGRHLPGGVPQDLRWAGTVLERLEQDVTMPVDIDGQLPQERNHPAEMVAMDAMRLPSRSDDIGWNEPLVYPATAPVVIEQEPNNGAEQAQQISLPCEVVGQFFPRRDHDWFQFEAKQGERWAIELFYNRMGAHGTPQVVLHRVVKNQDGSEQMSVVVEMQEPLARELDHEFDARSQDPFYLFDVPANGLYRISVRDGYAALRDDPRMVYRLAIRKPRPDFRLVALPWESEHALFLRKGGRALVRVWVIRRDGFDGEVRLNVEQLPGGVTANEVIVGPGANRGTIVLTCAEDAQPAVAEIQVRGKAEIEGRSIERLARSGAAVQAVGLVQPGEQRPSVAARLVRGLVLSIAPQEKLPVMLALPEQPLETSRGGVLKIPYTVTRRDNYNGSINAVVLGLPSNVNAPQVGIGGGANQGEFELRLPGNAPVGTYSLVLNAFAQGYQYARNPEAAKRAAERKAELEKIVAQTAEEVKRATDNRNASQKALDEAKANVQQMNAARDQAAKMAADTQAAVNSARQAAEQAAKAAQEKPDDQERAQKAKQAADALAEAETRAKQAAEKLAEAEKALVEAQEKLKKAEAARTEAEQHLQAAMQRAALAQQTKQQADRRAQQLQQSAQPRNINFWTPSTPVVVRIVESPVTVQGLPDAITVQQGEKKDITVQVTRSYGFDGPVNLNWRPPGNMPGVQLPNLQIPNGQNEGKFMIAAAENATVAQYQVALQIQVNFNGQNVVTEKIMPFSVVAKP